MMAPATKRPVWAWLCPGASHNVHGLRQALNTCLLTYVLCPVLAVGNPETNPAALSPAEEHRCK